MMQSGMDRALCCKELPKCLIDLNEIASSKYVMKHVLRIQIVRAASRVHLSAGELTLLFTAYTARQANARDLDITHNRLMRWQFWALQKFEIQSEET